MKLKFTKGLFIFAAVVSVTLFSCKKSSDEVSSFTWNYNATNYTGNYKTAFRYSMSVGPIIVANVGASPASGPGMRISVHSLNTGTYSFGNASPDYFEYIDADGSAFTVSGTLYITASDNDRISGNFACTFNNGTIALTGSFTNIPVED